MPDRFEDEDDDDTGIEAVDDDPWGDDDDERIGLDDDGDERLGLDGGAAVGRAPICGYCGVTMLPADPSNVIDTDFVCDNEDCENDRSRG